MGVSFKHIFVTPLKKIKPNEALKQALMVNDEKIFDLNRQQLDRGLDAKGQSLGDYARFSYKQRWRPIDLLKEGDWRKKFTLDQSRRNESFIFSQDWKDDILVWRYGKDIQGVPKVMYPTLALAIIDDFVNFARKQLNG